MLLKTLRENFTDALEDDYPETEIQSFFRLLAECYLKLKPVDVSMNLYLPISIKKVERFDQALVALKNHEPIQYILGTTEFYGLPFKVTKDTLIPRPETEELVSWVYEAAAFQNKNFNILDIGTGTGCVAISLAKNLLLAKVYAVDISPKALTVAKTNAKLNKADVGFFSLNILNWETEVPHSDLGHLKFDHIVSNPPYVRHLEKSEMSRNVLLHEPEIALYVADDDPLLFYRAILEYATFSLKKEGQLFFEINQYLGKEMKALLQHYGFKNIELRKDIFGNDRMIKGTI